MGNRFKKYANKLTISAGGGLHEFKKYVVQTHNMKTVMEVTFRVKLNGTKTAFLNSFRCH